MHQLQPIESRPPHRGKRHPDTDIFRPVRLPGEAEQPVGQRLDRFYRLVPQLTSLALADLITGPKTYAPSSALFAPAQFLVQLGVAEAVPVSGQALRVSLRSHHRQAAAALCSSEHSAAKGGR